MQRGAGGGVYVGLAISFIRYFQHPITVRTCFGAPRGAHQNFSCYLTVVSCYCSATVMKFVIGVSSCTDSVIIYFFNGGPANFHE